MLIGGQLVDAFTKNRRRLADTRILIYEMMDGTHGRKIQAQVPEMRIGRRQPVAVTCTHGNLLILFGRNYGGCSITEDDDNYHAESISLREHCDCLTKLDTILDEEPQQVILLGKLGNKDNWGAFWKLESDDEVVRHLYSSTGNNLEQHTLKNLPDSGVGEMEISFCDSDTCWLAFWPDSGSEPFLYLVSREGKEGVWHSKCPWLAEQKYLSLKTQTWVGWRHVSGECFLFGIYDYVKYDRKSGVWMQHDYFRERSTSRPHKLAFSVTGYGCGEDFYIMSQSWIYLCWLDEKRQEQFAIVTLQPQPTSVAERTLLVVD